MTNETHEAGCAAIEDRPSHMSAAALECGARYELTESRCNCLLGEVRRERAELSTAVESEKWARETVHKMETENGRLRARVEELEQELKLRCDLHGDCEVANAKLVTRLNAAEALLRSHMLTSEDYRIAEYFRNKEKR